MIRFRRHFWLLIFILCFGVFIGGPLFADDAEKEIDEFTEMTAPAADDALLILDDSTGTTKHIEVENFLTAVDVRHHGATGDGSTDDRASIYNANAKGKSLVFPSGTYKISSNLTISEPSYWMEGAKLSIDSGVTVTINATVHAGLHQIFSGDGTVSFGSGAVKEVYPEWWGNNTTPGTTDMTTPIQTAINVAANSGIRTVRGAPTVYKISTLYFYYDAVNNPGFPSGNTAQGRISLVGDGAIEYGGLLAEDYRGTVFVSSSTTAPAFKLDLETTHLRAVTLRGFSLVQNYAGYMIDCDQLSAQVIFDDLSLLQKNLGGSGILWEDVYLATAKMISVNMTGKTGGTGIGWAINHIDIGGGQISVHDSACTGWDGVGGMGFQLGLPYAAEGVGAFRNLLLESCAAQCCEKGISVRYGASSTLLLNCYFEGNTVNDILIADYPTTTTILSGNFMGAAGPTGGHIQIGDSALAGKAREWINVNIIGNKFANVETICINQDYIGTDSGGLTIIGNRFHGAVGTSVGIKYYDGASKHNIVELGNTYSNLTTDYENATNVHLRTLDDGLYLGRTYGTELITVASANDITMSTYGNFWRITGTTQIETISAPAYGCPTIVLVFTANVTVKHNTAGDGEVIYLSGAADFAATDLDTLTLIYNSNLELWQEVARTVI